MIYRHFHYSDFLGSFLDGLWSFVFCIALFQLSTKLIIVIFPFLIGLSFEFFQLIGKFIWPNSAGYYPGTPDFKDVVAYLIGSLIALIVILIIEKIFFNKGEI